MRRRSCSNWVAGQRATPSWAARSSVGPVVRYQPLLRLFVDALGLWGASKLSDGLGRKFPVYSYYDVVHLNYRLLRDHLKVGKVVLATGVSMGATRPTTGA